MKKKRCGYCHKLKPVSSFHRHRERGWQHKCKSCLSFLKERRRTYYLKSKRRSYLHRKYGITPEMYEAMLKRQRGRCLICSKRKKLVLDHCHDTGGVRGLLCDNCNVGIGKLEDNPMRLVKALHYLLVGKTAIQKERVMEALLEL